MAFELYITTSKMLGKDLLTEFLEDESKRARKLVYYHGVEDSLTYAQHTLLSNAQKRMQIQFEEIEPGELMFALGTLFGAVKQNGPIFVISDEAILPESIMERYDIKMYAGNPKTSKKGTEKKQERKPRITKPVKKEEKPVENDAPVAEDQETPTWNEDTLPINPPVEPEDKKEDAAAAESEDVESGTVEDAGSEKESVEVAETVESVDAVNAAKAVNVTENDTASESEDDTTSDEADAEVEKPEAETEETSAFEDIEDENPFEQEKPADGQEVSVPAASDDIPEILDKNKHTIFEKYFAGVDIEKLEKISDMDQLIKEVAYIIYQERYFGADVVEKLKERIGNGWELVNERVEQKHQIMKAFIPSKK